MKISGAVIQSSWCLFLLLSFTELKGQDNYTRDKLITIARDVIKASGTCALITLDGRGRPRARTMDPFVPDDDFVIRFGTNPRSRKVSQIKSDPRVTLYYSDPDPDGPGYVMIYGKAVLVDDPEQKAIWWKEEWHEFYRNKDKDFLVIKVVPEWLEVISYKYNIQGDSITWEPPKVQFE